MAAIDPELARLLTEFVEKVGLLRRDMQHRKELEHYDARMARIDQKLSALAERISHDDDGLARALRTAWQLPARSLAFRNAGHQREATKSASDPVRHDGHQDGTSHKEHKDHKD